LRDDAPPGWRVSVPAADEIWVPSRFATSAIAGLLGADDMRPIRAVPHAVSAAPFGPRKSSRDVIQARELRCGDLETWPAGASELARHIRDDPRILLFDGVARRIPIADLYLASDVYLSLHRSEGYGLNLAEAASLGTRVIATGWGLAEDIAALPEVETVASELVPVVDHQGAYAGLDARWAEPDIADAADKLRALAA
jgi:glycosyltransferase involved in cell wall biosynthesis